MRTGIITNKAGAVSASSRIPTVAMVLPGHASLRAAAVSSSCRFNRKTGVVTGTSRRNRRADHQRAAGGRSPCLTRRRTPGWSSPEYLAVIILNRQYTGPRGTLTADALWVRMRLPQRQKLVLATSVCVRADLAAAPPVSGATLGLTLGGLGLLVLGGIAYRLTRRRRKQAAAA